MEEEICKYIAYFIIVNVRYIYFYINAICEKSKPYRCDNVKQMVMYLNLVVIVVIVKCTKLRSIQAIWRVN